MAIEVYKNEGRAQIHVDVSDLKQMIGLLKEMYAAPYFGHDLVALLEVLEAEWKKLKNNSTRVTFPMSSEHSKTLVKVCRDSNIFINSYAGDGIALALKQPKY